MTKADSQGLQSSYPPLMFVSKQIRAEALACMYDTMPATIRLSGDPSQPSSPLSLSVYLGRDVGMRRLPEEKGKGGLYPQYADFPQGLARFPPAIRDFRDIQLDIDLPYGSLEKGLPVAYVDNLTDVLARLAKSLPQDNELRRFAIAFWHCDRARNKRYLVLEPGYEVIERCLQPFKHLANSDIDLAQRPSHMEAIAWRVLRRPENEEL